MDEKTRDAVVARVYGHLGEEPKPYVMVIGPGDFSPTVWKRTRDLVAFRLHRPQTDGTTVTDAAIYLLRDSDMYRTAAAALRTGATQKEYIWCLLAAVLTHESAHTAPKTEREALTAEAAQLGRCLRAGHLFSGDGWNPVNYLGKVQARLRNPREHY